MFDIIETVCESSGGMMMMMMMMIMMMMIEATTESSSKAAMEIGKVCRFPLYWADLLVCYVCCNASHRT